jgi:hypothetical protein
VGGGGQQPPFAPSGRSLFEEVFVVTENFDFQIQSDDLAIVSAMPKQGNQYIIQYYKRIKIKFTSYVHYVKSYIIFIIH